MIKKLFIVLLATIFYPLFGSAQSYDFEIEKPIGWNKVKLPNSTGGLEKYDFGKAEEEILKNHQKSIYIYGFTGQINAEGYTPNIQVYLRENPAATKLQFRQFIEFSVKKLNEQLDNFKIIEPIKEVLIDNKPALYFKASFNLKNRNGSTVNARTTVYAIPNGKTFYQFALNDTLKDNLVEVFSSALNTVKLK